MKLLTNNLLVIMVVTELADIQILFYYANVNKMLKII